MNWLQFGYQYGIGGLFFAATMCLCVRQGGSALETASDRWTKRLLLAGLVLFTAVNVLWICAVGA